MRSFLLVSLVFVVSEAVAQNQVDLADAAQRVLDAQAAGIASSVRPGDEQMSCEALQAEFVALAQSPEMQAFLQSSAVAQAQADFAAAQQAQAAALEETARPRRGLLRGMAQGAAAGVVPGLGRGAAMAQQAAAAAQAAQMQAQTDQNLQRVAALGDQAATMAGPAMRGQRLFELAQARNCAFLQEGGNPAGAFPPGVPPPQPGVPPPR